MLRPLASCADNSNVVLSSEAGMHKLGRQVIKFKYNTFILCMARRQMPTFSLLRRAIVIPYSAIIVSFFLNLNRSVLSGYLYSRATIHFY